MTALGVYVGNDASHLNQFEDWLGRDVDLVHAVVGSANWTDYTSSVSWMINSLWSGTNDSLFWSVPLIVADGSASLGTAASGAYNSYYRSVAQTIANNTDGDGPIYIRTGWEFNGDWFAWSAQGQAGNFSEAFRQFVDSFRSVSDRFKFEWNVDAASGGMNPADAYPGDDYVDIIGMDFYWKTEYSGSDPVKAFQDMAYREYGLQWLEDFAAAHGKPTAYSEWGVTGNNAADYIKLVQEWFDSHDVVYQSYWDSDSAYPGELSDGTDSNSGAAYKAAFSGPSDNASVIVDHPAITTPDVPATSTPTTSTPATSGGAPAESAAWTRQVWGSSAQETLSGSAGNDQLNGGGGDTLKGGAGDDTYVITTGDTVVEAAGQGIDTVLTWINNYVLPANVENLILTGTGWNSLTGNGLDNRLTGNDSPNTLNGRAGNDWLTGGGGADTFVIAKGEGNDTITDFSTSGGDVIRLDGFGFQTFAAVKAAATQAGSDLLINLGGGQTLTLLATKLASLAADDFALVNVTAPLTTTPGTPTTSTPTTSTPTTSTPTTTAPANSGVLPDSATPDHWVYGTARTETLVGTSGHDGFKSVGGGDTMKGGLGDDTYVVYTATDKVVELAGQGTDTVTTWLSSYTLPDNVENLVITGTSWTAATGNALANKIIGNDSPNTLNGGAGNDVLTGGGGADTFVIAKGMGWDLITDFEGAGKSGGDILRLAGFGAGATITHEDGFTFAIHAADGSTEHLTLTGVTSLAASDYLFA